MNDQSEYQLCIHFVGLSRTTERAILACLELFESEKKSAKFKILRSSGNLRSFTWR
jgi:hypothetical protein